MGGCDLRDDRDTPPSLVLSPSSALQGASLNVLLTAPGVPLSGCEELSGASVEFFFGEEPSAIEATTLEKLDADTLRARVAVSMLAPPGDHLVVLRCDEQTDLTGIFLVRERFEDAAIALEPSEVKAGSFYFQIDIFGEDVAFDADLSHAVFGDGTYVAVRDQTVVDGMPQMRVWVDADPLTPEGPMEVAVVTGDLVARGTIEILPRDTPWILVEPDYIELATAEEPPAQATLTITGTSIAFVEPDPEVDAGASDDYTIVSFPENPGLQVTYMEVNALDSSVMTVDILANSGAILGPTPLTVSTGGETVSAAFTVYPPGGGEAFLTVAPAHVPRGANAKTVVARAFFATPFTDEDPGAGDVHFEGDGCHIEKFERLSGTELAVDVSVDGDFTGGACALHVDRATQSLAATVAIVAPDAPALSGFTSIAQGASGVWIAVSSTEVEGVDPVVFDDDTVATAGLRSGVDIVTQLPSEGGESLLVIIDRVGQDAPVGEATLHVLDDGEDYVVEYSVIPSEETPSNVLVTPGTVFGARREASFGLESLDSPDAMEFDAGAPPEVGFDNPAVRATSVEVLDSRRAIVNASVLPSVDADSAVMYVTSGAKKAAASVRVLSAPQDIVAAVDPELARGGDTSEIVFVEAVVRAGVFQPGAVVGHVFDGIGVEVLGVDLYPDDSMPAVADELYLQLRIAPDGPAGWFGVVLADGRRTAVLPLRLVGEPESLTMEVACATVDGALRPGDVGVAVDATLPSVTPDGGPLSEARSGAAGAFARLESLDGLAASLTVDVSAEVAAGVPPLPEGIPIVVITGAGAAVGFAPYVSAEPEEPEVLSETTPVDVYLNPALVPVLRVDADPAAPFSYAVASAAEPGHADATISALAEDALSEQASSVRGLLWFPGGGDLERLLVRPVGDTGDLPSSLRLGSFGTDLVLEIEGDLPTELGDPCAAPSLVAASIGEPLDEDLFATESVSACTAVAVVLARSLGDRPWSTPDLLIEFLDDLGGGPPVDVSLGWPSASEADPRLYFTIDAAHPGFLRIAPEIGSAGSYLLNLRRAATIREICGGDGSAPAFIELDLRPGTDLSPFAIRLVDPISLLYVELLLSGTVPADGIVVIGNDAESAPDIADTTGVTDFPAGSPYAVQLVEALAVVDAVQVGGDPGVAGEGSPAAGEGDPRCFARPAVIDTNNNDLDFIGSWMPSPGE